MQIPESELILNKDGSIYHLALFPGDIADTIITVGDPERVAQVSQFFDRIELKKQHREFITHTGTIGNKRITALSTGMGIGNIDIVMTELDALINIDLKTRIINPSPKKLKIIRAGTSGGAQAGIPVDSLVVTKYAIGLDTMVNYYQKQNSPDEAALQANFNKHFANLSILQNNYVGTCDNNLFELLAPNHFSGITVTAGGFFGPQGRMIRANMLIANFVELMRTFSWQQWRVTNFEMETAAIYAMANILGHEACSVSAIIANRVTHQYSNKPKETVEAMIQFILDKVTS